MQQDGQQQMRKPDSNKNWIQLEKIFAKISESLLTCTKELWVYLWATIIAFIMCVLIPTKMPNHVFQLTFDRALLSLPLQSVVVKRSCV